MGFLVHGIPVKFLNLRIDVYTREFHTLKSTTDELIFLPVFWPFYYVVCSWALCRKNAEVALWISWSVEINGAAVKLNFPCLPTTYPFESGLSLSFLCLIFILPLLFFYKAEPGRRAENCFIENFMQSGIYYAANIEILVSSLPFP